MTILTFGNKKLWKKALLLSLFALCLVLVCTFILGQDREEVLSTATCDEIGSYSTNAADVAEQVKFLKQFGIKTTDIKPEVDTVIIPKSFNKTYKDYNNLQKKVGLNLQPYSGKEVNRAVYKIKKSKDYVTILIYKGHAVGGHISSRIYGEKNRPLTAG